MRFTSLLVTNVLNYNRDGASVLLRWSTSNHMSDSTQPNDLAERIAASVRKQIESQDSSRRSFLGKSALLGGTVLAIGGGSGAALAQTADTEHETPENATSNETMAMYDDLEGTDVDVLNYALTLEHIEAEFYRQGLEAFDAQDFMDAELLQGFDEARREEVVATITSFAEHEASHVDVLTQAVQLLGGEPAAAGTYEFGVETVDDMLALGQVVENTGASAYAGVAPFIDSPDLLSAALSIHSVEARHAAYLNQLNGASPAPDAYDPASSQSEVLEAVGPFITTEDGGGGTGDGGGGNQTGNEGPDSAIVGSQLE